MADAVAAIRAQRVEVDALLGLRHAHGEAAAACAWWRLVEARRKRLELLGGETLGLRPLPAPPPGAVTRLQRFWYRCGLLRWEAARMPARLARMAAGS